MWYRTFHTDWHKPTCTHLFSYIFALIVFVFRQETALWTYTFLNACSTRVLWLFLCPQSFFNYSYEKKTPFSTILCHDSKVKQSCPYARQDGIARNERTALLLRNLSIRRRWVLSFTQPAFYYRGDIPRHPLDRPESQSQRFRYEINLLSLQGIEPQVLKCPGRSLATTPTTLSRIIKSQNDSKIVICSNMSVCTVIFSPACPTLHQSIKRII